MSRDEGKDTAFESKLFRAGCIAGCIGSTVVIVIALILNIVYT